MNDRDKVKLPGREKSWIGPTILLFVFVAIVHFLLFAIS